MSETVIIPKNTKMLSIITFGVIAGASLATIIAVKEWMAAKKAANNKKLAEAELTAAAVEKGLDPNVAAAIPSSEFSGCCGATSSASGDSKMVKPYWQGDYSSNAAVRPDLKLVNRPSQPASFNWGVNNPNGGGGVFAWAGDACKVGRGKGRIVGSNGTYQPDGHGGLDCVPNSATS